MVLTAETDIGGMFQFRYYKMEINLRNDWSLVYLYGNEVDQRREQRPYIFEHVLQSTLITKLKLRGALSYDSNE